MDFVRVAAVLASLAVALAGCGSTTRPIEANVARPAASRPEATQSAAPSSSVPPIATVALPAEKKPETKPEGAPPTGALACNDAPKLPALDPVTKTALDELAGLQHQVEKEQLIERTKSNDVRVSATLRAALPRMKRLAREIVQRQLASVADRATGCDAALAAAIQSRLGAEGLRVGDQDGTGVIDRVELSRAPENPRRWVVTLSFTLPCGSDGSVYVFDDDGAALTLVLAVEANGYSSLADGQLDAHGWLSPPDASGHYFLVTTHGQPWCTSAWVGLRYRVFAPGRTPDAPKPLFDERASARLDDELAAVRTSPNGFDIRFVSWEKLGGEVARSHRRSYRLKNGRFERSQPFVERTRDLPDEWIQLPWPEATRLCAPGRQAALKSWHTRIRAALADNPLTFEKESKDTATGHTRITFQCSACKRLPNHLTFELAPGEGGSVIQAVTASGE